MGVEQTFTSPLRLPVGKKGFSLNLNVYRNAHFRTLSKAKKVYAELLAEQIKKSVPMAKVHIHYTLFMATKRRVDIANVTSVTAKFFCDALVEYGLLKDDDYHHVVSSSESFGGIDKQNPRVEIRVTEQ